MLNFESMRNVLRFFLPEGWNERVRKKSKRLERKERIYTSASMSMSKCSLK